MELDNIEHETALNCPICSQTIKIHAIVDCQKGTTRTVGLNGFNNPVVTTNLKVKVMGFKIHHECEYEDVDNG